MKLSVVICTRNPRESYLTRVLQALQNQSLSKDQWELLVVDNASDEPLATRFALDWHPAARHVREMEPGLTPARLRGINEAAGDILIFVDDDNVLEPTYLQTAERISHTHPFLGAWGGEIVGEFEVQPPANLVRYLGLLALREVREIRWSNTPEDWNSQPFGAGLCVRRAVARTYADECGRSRLRRELDRRGSDTLSGGDMDMVLTARVLDLGWGVFPSLSVTHLIPRSRLEFSYLLKLTEGIAASGVLLDLLHSGKQPPNSAVTRAVIQYTRALRRGGWMAARFEMARFAGYKRATRLYAEVASSRDRGEQPRRGLALDRVE